MPLSRRSVISIGVFVLLGVFVALGYWYESRQVAAGTGGRHRRDQRDQRR